MKKSGRTRSLIPWAIYLIVSIGNLPGSALALWEDSPLKIDQLRSEHISISVVPLSNGADLKSKTQNFGLTGFGTIDFSEAVKRYIRNSLANPFLSIRAVAPSLQLTNNAASTVETSEFQLAVGRIPLCDSHIKAHMLWNGNSIILGSVPQLDLVPPPSNDDWPRLDLAIEAFEDYLENNGIAVESKKLNRSEKCYAQRQNSLVPAWDLVLVVDGLGYRAIADGYEVLKFENLFFDVAGKIKTYDTNPVSGTLKIYDIDVIGDEHLTSEYFTTNTISKERAKEPNNEFIFEDSDFRFQEASAFAHAALMLEYFRGLGYTWHSKEPLIINLHAVVNSGVNNALYQPPEATSSGNPEITIGDGDGSVLKNLPVDSDVISHEFGHHIIYQTLRSVSGQSLIIHEGLADYFTFSRTNDSCLGESICPPDSLACWEKGSCLRSAENDIKYKTPAYTKLEAHLQGQLVSGFLWDLHAKGNIPFDEVTKILYTAISYFAKDSGLRDLVLALLLADDTETNGKYCKEIYAGAVERGFESLIADLSCSNKAESWGKPAGVSKSPIIETAPPQTRTKSPKPGLCGTTGGQKSADIGAMILLLMIFPMFFFKFKRAEVALGKIPVPPKNQS